jgi:ATP-binding cassette subfamily B protein
VIKAYSLEDQHQNNMVSLAKESKSKSLSLAKVQSLFGPLMLALIGISNLVVIYFGGLMYIVQSKVSVQLLNLFCT